MISSVRQLFSSLQRLANRYVGLSSVLTASRLEIPLLRYLYFYIYVNLIIRSQHACGLL